MTKQNNKREKGLNRTTRERKRTKQNNKREKKD